MSLSWTASGDMACSDCGSSVAAGETHYWTECLSRVKAEHDELKVREAELRYRLYGRDGDDTGALDTIERCHRRLDALIGVEEDLRDAEVEITRLRNVSDYQVPTLKRERDLLYEVVMNARSVLLFWHAGGIIGSGTPHGREAMTQMAVLDEAVRAYRDWMCESPTVKEERP